MIKRVVLILLPLIIGIAAITFFYRSAKPYIQTWLLSQIERLSEEKLPVRIKLKEINWSLLFPEVRLSEVELESKDGSFPNLQVKDIKASLDIIALFGGRLAISTLFFDEPNFEINIDPYLNSKSNTPMENLPLDKVFDMIDQIPLSRLGLKHGSFLIYSDKLKTGLLLGSTDLLVTAKKEKLIFQLDFNEGVLDYDTIGELPLRVQAEAQLTRNNLDISHLTLNILNSMIFAKGSLPEFQSIVKNPQGDLDFEIIADLQKTSQTAKNALVKFPDMSGKITSSGKINFASLKNINAGLRLVAQKIKVAQFFIGDISTQVSFQNDKLNIAKLELTNEFGLLDLKNIELNFTGDKPNVYSSANVSASFNTEQIDINALLQSLGLGNLPLEAFIKGKGSCNGVTYPNLDINCRAKLEGEQIEVRSGNKAENIIVLAKNLNAEGKVNINLKQVSYQADLVAGDDIGKSDGVISYNTGFNINYSTPRLQMKNIAVLAGLNLEGAGEISGSTSGDSSAATFSMGLKTKDFYFENFFLGSPTGALSYKAGHLYFNDVEGSFPNTRYKANLEIDLGKSLITATGELPEFEINEVLKVFHRIFKTPVEVSGTGNAKVQLHGPFALGKLSYDLTANMQRGSIVGEAFDKFETSLHSENGEVVIQKAQITKSKNVINATGVAHPNGDIDVRILGQKLLLDESDNISKLGSLISGFVDADTQLKGFVLNPDLKIKARVSQLSIEEREFNDSFFQMTFDEQMFQGSVELFGKQLTTNFKFPASDNGQFSLNFKSNMWNYTTLFALIGGGSLLNEYEAALTGEIELSSDRGGLWAASGGGTFSELFLKRGPLSLRNNKPISIKMENGVISLKHFLLTGDQTFFSIDGSEITKTDMAMNMKGQANLRLFQIFVPFLEELAGSATFTANTSGPLLKPEILGQGAVRNGFAKIKGFPHAFEKINSDVQFSQSKILINSFNGLLGGGTFSGDGVIAIEGPKNLPTSVKAKLSKVNLNVPDRVRTTGDGEIVFSGNWFPFVLSGTYYVSTGYIDKELEGESNALHLKQSSYLPKIILQGAFEPVLLDISVVLEKPVIIKNSMVEGSITGRVLVQGPPASPALSGQINTEKGTKAIFKEKSFEILNGSVKFNGDTEINPELFVSARSRISDYDINLLVQGPAKDPALKLNSVPPLSEADIRSLIVMGVTSQSLEQSSGTVTSEKVNKGIAAGLITQFQPVKQLQKSTGVEIQIYATDDTKAGSVQKVTLSKKLSEKVKAAATQTTGSKSQSNEYTLQYNFTDSLSAIGRYEDKKYIENSGNIENSTKQDESIFGIDLEFKREFK